MKPVNNLPLNDYEHPGRVCRGPFPVDQGSCIGLLWVAFIGGDYLVEHSKVSLPNFFVDSARVDPEAWAADFQYKLVQGSKNPLIASGMFCLNKKNIDTFQRFFRLILQKANYFLRRPYMVGICAVANHSPIPFASLFSYSSIMRCASFGSTTVLLPEEY